MEWEDKMGGFFEDLLREGSQAGLGYFEGQRQGQAQQQAALAQKQREELENALLQAQISNTGRMNMPDAVVPDPLTGLIPDPGKRAGANALTGTGRTRYFEQLGILDPVAPTVDAPDPAIAARKSALEALNGDLNQGEEGYLSPQDIDAASFDPVQFRSITGSDSPDEVSATARFNAARARVQAVQDALLKLQTEPYMRQSDLEQKVNQIITDSHFKDMDEYFSYLDYFSKLPEGGGNIQGGELPGGATQQREAWQSDPRAVAKIEEIEGMVQGGQMEQAEGERQVAEVKRRASGG